MSAETNNDSFRENMLAVIKEIQEELNNLKTIRRGIIKKSNKRKTARKNVKRKTARKSVKRKTARKGLKLKERRR